MAPAPFEANTTPEGPPRVISTLSLYDRANSRFSSRNSVVEDRQAVFFRLNVRESRLLRREGILLRFHFFRRSPRRRCRERFCTVQASPRGGRILQGPRNQSRVTAKGDVIENLSAQSAFRVTIDLLRASRLSRQTAGGLCRCELTYSMAVSAATV